MSWCKRCGCDVGMAEIGCKSCDHSKDWVTGEKPSNFRPRGLYRSTQDSGIQGNRIPAWLLIIVAFLAGMLISGGGAS